MNIPDLNRIGKQKNNIKASHIRWIDDALAELGPSGEVRIIKQRGKLRFIQKVESENVTEGSEE